MTGEIQDDGARDFNWIADAADVVVPDQAAIAVYRNARGDIVVRQEASITYDEDHLVVVAPEHAQALAHAILSAAGVPDTAGDIAGAEPGKAAKDRTGAERQRRFRERHGKRNGEASRNGETPLLAPPASEDRSHH